MPTLNGTSLFEPVTMTTNNGSTDDADWSLFFDCILANWITGTLALLGMMGNLVSFFALRMGFTSSPMFLVLRALAVADFAFLANSFVTLVLANFIQDGGEAIQCVVWPMIMATQMMTVWLTVLVSWERFVAICQPFLVSSICTSKRISSIIVAIFVFSILFNLPRFFEFTIQMVKSDVGNNEVYRYLYSSTLYGIFLFLLPLASLVFLNFRLVRELRLSSHRRSQLHYSVRREQRREQRLTSVPLTIVVIFFVCGTPSLAVNIADAVYDARENPVPNHYTIVANLLVIVNSASNLVVYFLLGRRFRLVVLRMFSCGFYAKRFQSRTPSYQRSDAILLDNAHRLKIDNKSRLVDANKDQCTG